MSLGPLGISLGVGREQFKRARRGLYAGVQKLTGNNVSRSMRKCGRSRACARARARARLRWVVCGAGVVHVGGRRASRARRTRRTWLPNVHKKRIFSDALDRLVRVRVSTKALRIMDVKGGLDNYVLQTSDEALGSDFGMRLRADILKARAKKAAVAKKAGAGGAVVAPSGLLADAR